MKDKKIVMFSWALYDFADSVFATSVMAGFFPLFFKGFWFSGTHPEQSTFYLGLANSIASVLMSVFSPFLGAVADETSAQKKFLLFFAFIGISATSGFWLIEKGFWKEALVLYSLASIGFSGAHTFYDALLLRVASSKKVDFLSSLGYALGYIGGGILLLLHVCMYRNPGLFGISDTETSVRIAFLTVALWWFLFSLPLIFFVPEDPKKKITKRWRSLAIHGWKHLIATLIRIMRNEKMIFYFLLAYWLYIDGIHTIIRMAVDYGQALNFPSEVLITALLLVQFFAFPAALVFYRIARKTGIKKAIMTGIGCYAIITLLGFFMYEIWHFYLLAVLIAMFQGGIQALSRSYFSRLIPEEKAGEYFGFFNMVSKFAAVLGPILVGGVAVLTSSNRVGILSLLLLFFSGMWVLKKVPIAESCN